MDGQLGVEASSGRAPLRPAAHAGTPLELREFGLAEAAERFGAPWHELLRRGDYNISLAPEYVQAAAASVGLSDRIRVVVAHRAGEMVGVIPYFETTDRMMKLPMVTLRLAGNLISYHHEVAALDCHEEMLRAFLGDPKRRWHVLCMENVPTDGPTCAALHKLAGEVGSSLVSYPGDVAPYVPITQGWDAFLAERSSNFRYNLKRKEKALKKGGTVEERWFHEPQDVDELYRCVEHIESKSWKSTASVAISSKPNEALYYQQLLPALARRGLLFANVIYVNATPVAYHLCYRFEGRVGNMKTSFDEASQALSPGAVVIQHAIQKAFETGAREFDFLGDDQYHKRLWTQSARAHQTHFLFSRSLRSRAIGMAKRYVQARRKTEFHAVLRRSDTLEPESTD
jgi:CelD/BcsL family acetyltransferase involved in cellulose biosynthesis